MSDIESKLRTSLYRAFCPDSSQLGEYYLELLPANRRREIRLHLKECPHCTRELAELGSYLEAVRRDLEPGPGEQLRRLAARLTGGALGGWAPAAVRGEAGQTLNFTAEGYQVILDIQPDAAHPDRKTILGLLMGEAPAGFEARLYAAETLVAQTPVDELGNFALNRVQPGGYTLTLSNAQVEIQVEQITLS